MSSIGGAADCVSLEKRGKRPDSAEDLDRIEEGEDAIGMEDRSVRLEALDDTRWCRVWPAGSRDADPFRDGGFSCSGKATSLSEDRLCSSDGASDVAREDHS